MQKQSDVFYSAYERREDDSYPTIDTRCVDGFLAFYEPTGLVVDSCARGGSAIVDYFQELHKSAVGLTDCFEDAEGDWLVTNPPFRRNEVNKIVEAQIMRVTDKKFYGLALLVRNNWAFAKTRAGFFNLPIYAGEIKLLFRPWWTDDRSEEPKHNYVWHIWHQDGWAHRKPMFYLPPYNPKYARRKREA